MGRKPSYEELAQRVGDLEKEILLAKKAEGRQSGLEKGVRTGNVLSKDTRERSELEEALRESEARYRHLVEQIPAITYTAAIDGLSTTEYISPQADTMLGFRPEEWREGGDIWLQQLHPDDRDRVLDEVAVSHETGKPLMSKYRMLTRDGRVAWFRDEASVVKDEEGRSLCLQGVMFDITGRKEREALLAKSEAQMAAMIECLPFDFFLIDRSGRYALQNSACRENWGDVIGKYPGDVANDQTTLSIWEKNNARVFAGQVVKGEVTFQAGGGERFYYNTLAPVRVGDEILAILAINVDITALKQTEEALHKSEAKYRALFDNVPDGVGLFTLEGTVLETNRAFSEITGYTPGELKGANVAAIYMWPKERERFLDHLMSRGSVQNYEIEFKRKNGSPLYVSANVAFFGSGENRVILSAIKDITHRKLAEQALKAAHETLEIRVEERTAELSAANEKLMLEIEQRKEAEVMLSKNEEQFRTLVANIPGAVYRCAFDDEWSVEFISGGVRDISGHAPSEFWQHHLFTYNSMTHPEDRERVNRVINEAVDNKEPFSLEFRVIRADGSERWVHERGRGVFDENGQCLWLDGVFFDITSQKQAAQALQAVEERNRLLLETMNDGLGVVDRKGLITYVNSKLLELTGYRREELVGQPVADFVYKSERTNITKEMLGLRKGARRSYEMVWKRKSGRKLQTITSSAPVFSAKGDFEGCFAVLTDITELKKTEAALREREKELDLDRHRLEEVNTALKVLLRKRAEDIKELEENVLGNMEKIVRPHLRKLRSSGLSQRQMSHVDLLESNLGGITSTFVHDLSSMSFSLTRSEIQVADLVRQGKSSKEIAALLGVSKRTVDFHRGRIRHKLGLNKKRANLRTNLLALQ